PTFFGSGAAAVVNQSDLDGGVFGLTPTAGYSGDSTNGGVLSVTLTGGAPITPATALATGAVTAISTPFTTTPYGAGAPPLVVITPADGNGFGAFAVAYLDTLNNI